MTPSPSQPTHLPTVVFSGGGTAGHLFPGLAVARRLAGMLPKLRIVFAGGGREQEKRLIEEAGFHYLTVPCRALPRRLRDVLPFVAINWSGYRAARRFLAQNPVRVVVGLGGYASVPMARAALRRRIPLVLMEQNVVPGRANRWLARRADVLCSAFAEVKHYLPPHCHWRVTGNPVRDTFLTNSPAESAVSTAGRAFHGAHRQSGLRPPWPPLPTELAAPPGDVEPPPVQRPHQLVVLGGSRGARWLNTNVPLALAAISKHFAGWRVVHQTGHDDHEATAAIYRRLKIDAVVQPFIADVAKLLAGSDAAICRAGGTTLAELAACGVPALLVPYPHAADDHQRRNAEVFAAAGACFLLDEREAEEHPEQSLAALLLPLVGSRSTRDAMSERMRALAHPDAAADIATMIGNMLGEERLSPASPNPKQQSAA
ncbi:MAG: UDP-N-acetylglucosamine--N-acetylmuramyl-(pentapeptide) pyrophosphoryl-undecaprenol N-acetylglucosamine transferase [Planctomycetaceae bacterium]|nr:UDP-N-acetylglucosamine--N-acetylmuramyl-(pentapeptide) pyrophosphoryl-undecaprenol N-acetylglucosamine transferase [Planctomycetaceae bacterium]